MSGGGERMTMDVETAIRTRRTHKAFAPEPLARDEIEELLELARWAPNHHLTAPWRFRVLGPDALERLKRVAGEEGAAKLSRAPTLIVSLGARSAATRSKTRRTCTRPPSPPTSSCSAPTPAGSPATGARRRCSAPPRAGPRSAWAMRSASSASCTSVVRARPPKPPPSARASSRRRSSWTDAPAPRPQSRRSPASTSRSS